MIRAIVFYFIWFAVWMLLAWPPEPKDVIVGIVVSLFVSVMTVDLVLRKGRGGRSYAPLAVLKRVAWFIVYVFVFLWECIKANIDVAYRVLHPDLPIRPGTIRINVNLKSDIGLTFLANSITLTPGTTSIDVDKARGCLYIHWLYVRDAYGPGGKTLPVVVKFERILGRIFE